MVTLMMCYSFCMFCMNQLLHIASLRSWNREKICLNNDCWIQPVGSRTLVGDGNPHFRSTWTYHTILNQLKVPVVLLALLFWYYCHFSLLRMMFEVANQPASALHVNEFSTYNHYCTNKLLRKPDIHTLLFRVEKCTIKEITFSE